MELPLPEVESVVLIRDSDEAYEKLLSDVTDDIKPDATEIIAEGLSFSDADEPLELVPVVDEDSPLG